MSLIFLKIAMERAMGKVCYAFILFFFIPLMVDGQSGVCYTNRGSPYTVRRSVQRHYTYYVCCGWWCWRRCARTGQRTDYYVGHETAYTRVFQCCHGYALGPNSQCIPVCIPPCQNGGTCMHMKPSNVCQCTDDWLGPYCSTKATIKPSPRFGNMLGGTLVYIQTQVPTREDESISCKFGGKAAITRRISPAMLFCVSPSADKEGQVRLELQIGQRGLLTSQFFYKSPEYAHGVSLYGDDGTIVVRGGSTLEMYWSPQSLVSSNTIDQDILVDISIHSQTYNPQNRQFSLDMLETLKQGISNDGEETVTLNEGIVSSCYGSNQRVRFNICPVFFKVSVSEGHTLPAEVTAWSGVVFLNSSNSPQFTMEQCSIWSLSTNDAIRLRRLQSCPPTEDVVRSDIFYQFESMISLVTRSREYHFMFMRFFHPSVGNCYRQSIPNLDRSGQQCCYGTDGVLIRQPVGGSADRISPVRSYYEHIIQDLLPFIHCCRETDSVICQNYFQQRPAGSSQGYVLILPAFAVGDPHLVTLDGHKYTFNGRGEFILIQTDTNAFTLQGRMEQALDGSGNKAPGTVFTAIAAKQPATDTTVQVEVRKSDQRLHVLRNMEEVSFEFAVKVEFEDVVFTAEGNSTVAIQFSGGVSIEVTANHSIIASFFVSLPSSMKRTTSGLMGSFNGIVSDDLLPRNGTQPLSLDDTIENIHHKFGLSWIIRNKSESLFTYGSGESWSRFFYPNYVPTFSPTFNNVTLEREAKRRCGKDQFCLFDIAATKRVEIGVATMQGINVLNEITEMARPVICDPTCTNGVCLKNNTCHCYPGYTGDRCTEEVNENCTVNRCKNNGTCIRRAMIATCVCLPDYMGSFCENRVPPFSITVINGSPIVSGNQVLIYFSTSKPATVDCILDGIRTNCTKGFMRYTDITQGAHLLRIVALTGLKEKAIVHRSIYIGSCAVYFINNGVSVTNGVATIEFLGSPDVTSFKCRVDRAELSPCRSPHRYQNLSSGQHKVVIRPANCNRKEGRQSHTFFV